MYIITIEPLWCTTDFELIESVLGSFSFPPPRTSGNFMV